MLHRLLPGDLGLGSLIQYRRCTCHQHICRSRTLFVDHLSMDVIPVGLCVAQLNLLGSFGKETGEPLH